MKIVNVIQRKQRSVPGQLGQAIFSPENGDQTFCTLETNSFGTVIWSIVKPTTIQEYLPHPGDSFIWYSELSKIINEIFQLSERELANIEKHITLQSGYRLIGHQRYQLIVDHLTMPMGSGTILSVSVGSTENNYVMLCNSISYHDALVDLVQKLILCLLKQFMRTIFILFQKNMICS